MSEAAADAPATESTEAVTWENSPIAQVYNPDGSPRENAGEALKALGYDGLDGFALNGGNQSSIFEALSRGKEARAGLSQRQEGMVKALSENSSAEDIQRFRSAVGALNTPDEYKAQLWPEQMPEGVEKDEKLAEGVSAWAVKNNIPAAAVKELAEMQIMNSAERSKSLMDQHVQEGNERAEATQKALIQELGGEKQFHEFSESVKQYLVSDAGKKAGFDFVKVDTGDGKFHVNTENPIHAAMMTDKAFLKVLGNFAKTQNPAKLPNGQPSQGSASTDKARLQELTRKVSSGTINAEERREYNEALGIKVG